MKGKRYKVIKREYGDLFEMGDIVIALDESDAPNCVKEEHYEPVVKFWDYDYAYIYAMNINELEEL